TALARLPGDEAGASHDLVGERSDGVLEGAAEEVAFATAVPERRKAGAPDRGSDRAEVKRAPEGVADDNAETRAGRALKRVADRVRGGVRIGQEEEHPRTAACWRAGGGGVAGIDAGVGDDEAEPVTDDEDVLRGAGDACGLAQ